MQHNSIASIVAVIALPGAIEIRGKSGASPAQSRCGKPPYGEDKSECPPAMHHKSLFARKGVVELRVRCRSLEERRGVSAQPHLPSACASRLFLSRPGWF